MENQVEKVSSAVDRKAASLTIYNDDIALIREEREIKVEAGFNRVAMRDVAAKIIPETSCFTNKSDNVLRLLEQNFDFDLLTPGKLMDKYVGKTVTIISINEIDGSEVRETAEVLANNKGVVLKYADRIETGLPKKARIAFGELPDNLRDHPTLLLDFLADKSGLEHVGLSYLSMGFSWRANYVANLAKDEKTFNLAGWVTLTNKSGAAFSEAQLQLVAGSIHRVHLDDAPELLSGAYLCQESGSGMEEESLLDYHLYTLGRPTNLNNHQTKQVALLSAANVPATKQYRINNRHRQWDYTNDNSTPEDGTPLPVAVVLKFANRDGDLGIPLPKGVVRVYGQDSRQQTQFLGEDLIDHTPKNATIALSLGNAFDITARRKFINIKKLTKEIAAEAQISIELANAKNDAVTVNIIEEFFGEWLILQSSHDYRVETARLAQWFVPIPAESSTTLTFKVQVKW
ncbi:DUF4139 domain-containing protein [Betaproteobacteria bacterium]|nr:DUF4139 domain-containing protein [Betaproteobacteria bacterium]GHU39887.1 DUF4139 domain-containing protein [Betaproteobacteria bacterium]